MKAKDSSQKPSLKSAEMDLGRKIGSQKKFKICKIKLIRIWKKIKFKKLFPNLANFNLDIFRIFSARFSLFSLTTTCYRHYYYFLYYCFDIFWLRESNPGSLVYKSLSNQSSSTVTNVKYFDFNFTALGFLVPSRPGVIPCTGRESNPGPCVPGRRTNQSTSTFALKELN